MLLSVGGLSSTSAHAEGCTFAQGFAALHEFMPSQVGDCIDNATYNPETGDALQHTTGGILVWRKLDNLLAFTDGSSTWINSSDGLVQRASSELFSVEPSDGGQLSPPPAAGDQPVTVTVGVVEPVASDTSAPPSAPRGVPAPPTDTAPSVTAAPQSGGPTGVLQGHVSIGPLTPVQPAGPPQPASGAACSARSITVLGANNTAVVTAQLASDCSYRLELSPGTYTVRLTPLGLDRSAELPAKVVIISGATAQLDFSIDTGIR